MADKKRTNRFTEEELEIIKGVFAENYALLNAVRKVILQMPLTALDLVLIKNITDNKAVQQVVRKAFLPTLDPEAPRNGLMELWATIDLKSETPMGAYPIIQAVQKMSEYLEQQLHYLETGEQGDINFSDSVKISDDETDTYINLVFRSKVISHTEAQLNMFELLAGQKDETVEETQTKLIERLKKDSSK